MFIYFRSIMNLKFLIRFSLLASTCILSADADTDAKIRNLQSRVNSLEYMRGSCLVNPSGRPTQKCDWGGYITIDPILLNAQENGLEFVLVTQNVGQGTAAASDFIFLSGKTKAKSPNFDWDWGFRAGIGVNLPRDGWDLYLNWMRLRSFAHKSVQADGITEWLTPVFVSNQTQPFAPLSLNQGLLRTSKSTWRLLLNELDLELGRQFFVSKWLTLKPHGGLRTAWIRQKNGISYNDWQPNASIESVDITHYFVNMKCNYWGIGFKGGLDTQWGIGCGWSLFANFDAAILYGYFDIFNDQSADFAQIAPIDFFSYHDFYHISRFITDFIAGIRYDYLFCDERYHLGIQVGWEHHLFFDQNQFTKFIGAGAFNGGLPGVIIANQGDLSFQGFSAQVRFDF